LKLCIFITTCVRNAWSCVEFLAVGVDLDGRWPRPGHTHARRSAATAWDLTPVTECVPSQVAAAAAHVRAPVCRDRMGTVSGDRVGSVCGDRMGRFCGDRMGSISGDCVGRLICYTETRSTR
jgi:hypothetical protein